MLRPRDRLQPGDRTRGAEGWRRPLTALVGTFQDGRALNAIFLAMLGLTVITVGSDLTQMIGAVPEGTPGSQRIEPAPMELPEPGDQLRPYLPRTMPVTPGRGRPSLPGLERAPTGEDMAAPMRFVLAADGEATAVGSIAPGTAARFASFLEQNERQVGTLNLHSPGGSVSDALEMGRALRAEGIDTRVPANAYCASSCPLVLAAGLHRETGTGAYVGVHQIYAAPGSTGTLESGMRDAQFVTALAQSHLVAMGVDPRLWLHALATPPAQLYVLTPEEIRRYDLANGPRPRTRPVMRPLPNGAAPDGAAPDGARQGDGAPDERASLRPFGNPSAVSSRGRRG